MTENWLELARQLADSLQVDGGLDSEWRQSFAAVPRHHFVRQFLESKSGSWFSVNNDSTKWTARVYKDVHLITQIRASSAGGVGAQRPTSSSSMPSVMAWMLQATQLREGESVLEIGTGTGYNAALLCHRLGADHVTSMDIDPELVSHAEERLKALDQAPTLVVGDGAAGHPENAPYDAILATAAVDHIPPAWIEQLKPGGRIVADLRGEFSGAMTTLVKLDDGTVEGHCHDLDVAFMPMRTDVRYPLRNGPAAPVVLDRRNPQRALTQTNVALLTTSASLRFVAELQLGATRAELFTTDDELVINAADESWASVSLNTDDDGFHTVQQGGPRRVWDSIETAFTTWNSAGQPSRSAFGVSASTTKNDQRVWLRAPDAPPSWPLPL